MVVVVEFREAAFTGDGGSRGSGSCGSGGGGSEWYCNDMIGSELAITTPQASFCFPQYWRILCFFFFIFFRLSFFLLYVIVVVVVLFFRLVHVHLLFNVEKFVYVFFFSVYMA